MQLPMLHMNGTSAERLIDDLQDAACKLQEAVEAMCVAAPNGRDYYPMGFDAFEQARKEHFARLAKVNETYDELNALIVAIADLRDNRGRMRS